MTGAVLSAGNVRD